jgi:hypothetical protein
VEAALGWAFRITEIEPMQLVSVDNDQLDPSELTDVVGGVLSKAFGPSRARR